MRYHGRIEKRPLPAKARPQQCGTALTELRVARQVNCGVYDRCLQLAVESDWDGFDCRSCPGFTPLTAFEQRRDMHGLAAVLEKICGR